MNARKARQGASAVCQQCCRCLGLLKISNYREKARETIIKSVVGCTRLRNYVALPNAHASSSTRRVYPVDCRASSCRASLICQLCGAWSLVLLT